MSIEFEARAEAIRRYGVVDESGHLDYDGAAFVEGYIAGATRPVTDAEADAAQTAFHEYVIGADEPLTERGLSVARQAWKVAIKAARALADKERGK